MAAWLNPAMSRLVLVPSAGIVNFLTARGVGLEAATSTPSAEVLWELRGS